MNSYTTEGGDTGAVAWTRLKIDALKLPVLLSAEVTTDVERIL